MTTIASTISPRRRSRTPEQPAPAISAVAPIPEIELSPRVLIRLPAIKSTAPAPIAKPTVTDSTGIAIEPSPATVVAVPPWYARLHTNVATRLNTPRAKTYVPYTTAVVVAIGMFVLMRSHSGKPHPVAVDSEAPAWNSGAALPHSQVTGPTATSPGNVPNWNGPTWPASNGAPLGAAPNAPGGSPSAWQPPPNPSPTSNYQSSAPTNGGQGAGAPTGTPGDSVPPMPARSPTWSTPPADPGVVQNSPVASEIHTAQASDPATIPPGHSPNDASQPGVAQFQGMITRPQ